MAITCIIRYQIDPFQREAFRAYATAWGRIIPRCGGHLIGYFLPHEGTNDVAWGLIAFESLAAYETYRARLRDDPEARENFGRANRERLILREERNFVEVVEGTFGLPPEALGDARRDALGLTFAALAATHPAAALAQAPATLRVGTPPFEAAAEVYFAKEQGYFAKAGLDVQIVPIVNSSAIAEAVAAGSVEIGFSAVLSIAIAHARGIPFVIVAPGNVHDSAAQIAALVVPNASPIHTARNLTGKTIGIPALKTISEYAPRIWIDRNGGDSMTVKFLELPFPSMADALAAGRIDAAWLTEPFISSNKRTTRVLAYAFDTIAHSFTISAWFATITWARANADVVTRFSSAIRAAGAWATQNPGPSADILTRDLKLDPATLAAMIRTRFADRLVPAAIQPQIDVAARYGLFAAFPAADLLLGPAR